MDESKADAGLDGETSRELVPDRAKELEHLARQHVQAVSQRVAALRQQAVALMREAEQLEAHCATWNQALSIPKE